jgi:phosphotriesterase-related protein
MRQVMTVLGPVTPESLGATSMHDHVLADLGFFRRLPDEHMAVGLDPAAPIRVGNLAWLRGEGQNGYCRDNWDLADVAMMTREVAHFAGRGGGAILEASVPGIRANPLGLKRIAARTGVHIMAGTGLYREETWPAWARRLTADGLRHHLRREIREGIEGTGVRAGHIKMAIARGSPREFRMVRAAVSVAMETGLPLTVHTSSFTPLKTRRRLLAMLLGEGLEPARLVLCHVQYSFGAGVPGRRGPCLDWAKEVLGHGANTCVDLFGIPTDNETMNALACSDAAKALAIADLVAVGHADRLVVGCDVFQRIMLRRFGGYGYARILDFLPSALRALGVGQVDIDRILVANPARLLAHDPEK